MPWLSQETRAASTRTPDPRAPSLPWTYMVDQKAILRIASSLLAGTADLDPRRVPARTFLRPRAILPELLIYSPIHVDMSSALQMGFGETAPAPGDSGYR